MDKQTCLLKLKAKPGKESYLADFIRSDLTLVEQGSKTTNWCAFTFTNRHYGIFDTLNDESVRDEHLYRELVKALIVKQMIISIPTSN